MSIAIFIHHGELKDLLAQILSYPGSVSIPGYDKSVQGPPAPLPLSFLLSLCRNVVINALLKVYIGAPDVTVICYYCTLKQVGGYLEKQ